jgi:hypothetical protein
MEIKARNDFVPTGDQFFYAVVAVKAGLSSMCARNKIELKEARDEFDIYKYAVLEFGETIFMIENYFRNNSEQYQLLFLVGDKSVRTTAQKIIDALGISGDKPYFIDSAYVAATELGYGQTSKS